jgi:hypothetical protein
MPEKQIKVRVSDRWRVVHDGKPYVKGDVLTVPESVAQEWERSRWVERATGKASVTSYEDDQAHLRGLRPQNPSLVR